MWPQRTDERVVGTARRWHERGRSHRLRDRGRSSQHAAESPPAGLLGLGGGLLSGLFGVGGGIILVPGLVFLLGLRQHHAHATSLAAIPLMALAALAGFALAGEVDYVVAAGLTVGALLGAAAGAGLMHRIAERRLAQCFAVLLGVIALRLLLADAAPAALSGSTDGGLVAEPHSLVGVSIAAILGLAAGGLSALLGVGGGVILVPILVLVFGFGQHAAEGTSLLVIIPTALLGAARHTRRGFTRWRLGMLVGLGGVLGGLAGAQIALALPSAWLQRLFGLLLAIVCVRLIRRTRRSSEPR